nr:MAG: putative capsid protein 1 [Polycipiviridae sp.]
MIEPTEQQKIDTNSRAKEIDHGTVPVPMSNAILGMPTKPGNQFDDRSSIKAMKWTFDQLVGQKQLIDTITINKQTDTLKPAFLFRNSWNQINSRFFNNLASLFYLKSFKLNFGFQFRSNFQQVGMMALSYCNYPTDSIPYLFGDYQLPAVLTKTAVSNHAYDWPAILDIYKTGMLDTMRAIYQLPHVFVMMGEDQDVPISINWVSPFKAGFHDNYETSNDATQRFEYFNNDYDMGMLRLHVPIKMSTAQGVTDTLTVRIYGWISDIEYSGYSPSDSLF